MKITIGEKLKIMRESERMTSRVEAAEMLGIPSNALWRYEEDKTIPNAQVVTDILNHPLFEKYALWFMTGKIAPEAGQIAPALAHYGQEKTESSASKRKIG